MTVPSSTITVAIDLSSLSADATVTANELIAQTVVSTAILQGPRGVDGAQGEPGHGVPASGLADQVLSKIDGTDYNVQWATPPSAPVTSVAGRTGAIVLAEGDITNLTTDLAAKVAKDELVINVKDHGAVGDGTTDDTAAIQAAIDFASANKIGSVVFQSLTYSVTGVLHLASNVSLVGTTGTVIKVADNNTGQYYLFGIQHVQNVTIKGITVEGNYARVGYDISVHPAIAVYIVDSTNIHIEDNIFNTNGIWTISCETNVTYPYNDSIYVERNIINYIVGKNSVTPAADGFTVDTTQMYMDAKNYWVRDNIITTTGTDAETAIEAHRRNGTVSGNIITGFRNGIIITPGQFTEPDSVTVTKMNITGNQLFSMEKGINIWQGSTRDLDNIIVSSNSIELDPARFPLCVESKGIFLLATSPTNNGGFFVKDVHIFGNIIRFKPFTTTFTDSNITIEFAGIRMYGWVSIKNIMVKNNMVINAPATGILVGIQASVTYPNTAASIIVEGNTIVDAGQDPNITTASFNPLTPIRVNGQSGYAVTNTVVRDNTIIDNQTSANFFTNPLYLTGYDASTCNISENLVIAFGYNGYFATDNSIDRLKAINQSVGASSGVDYGMALSTTVANTSTAGYTGLDVNVTETSIGSGTNLLANFRRGGVNKFSILRNSQVSMTGTSGSLLMLPNSDGGDFNIFHAEAGTKTLAFYGVSGSTMNVNILDGTFTVTVGPLVMGSAVDMQLSTVTGTKFGTSTSQKLAFYNSTPIIQPTGNVLTALSNLGIVATPTLAESDITNLTGDLAAKQPVDTTLTSLAAYNTNGLLTQTAADTFTGRILTGTSNQVVVSNGDGVSGNPTLSLPQNIHTGASPAFLGLTVDTSTLSVDSTNHRIGYLTTAPTHTSTHGSTSTGIAAYRTIDQTTNFERARFYWNGSTYTIAVEAGGTGNANNPMVISAGSNTITLQAATNAMDFFRSATGVANVVRFATSGLNASSGTQSMMAVLPTITQTSTAGYTALLVNPTESTIGSGAKLLADLQVGGTSKLKVDNTGKIIVPTGGAASVAGTGTLVAGTVTISTTAVTANSLVFLQDTAGTITNVGTLTVSSKSAGTSFTVTSTLALDTSTFNWFIIN